MVHLLLLLVLLLVRVLSQQGAGGTAARRGACGAGLPHTANASCWRTAASDVDATAALQAAIDSGAYLVTVPYTGRPWMVAPVGRNKTAIWLRRSNQTILFEPGVVVRARRGAPHFLRPADLFRGEGLCNVTLLGCGARFEMHRDDYFLPPYCAPPCVHDEFRMTLGLYLSRQITIRGLAFAGSGGDGISLISVVGVRIDDVTCQHNARMGLSACGALNLVVTNSRFLDTNGTAPQSGVWLQPGVGEQHGVATLDNISFANNTLAWNYGGGFNIQSMINAYSGSTRAVNMSSVHMRFDNTTVVGCVPSPTPLAGPGGNCPPNPGVYLSAEHLTAGAIVFDGPASHGR
jgi:hypothetical protein